MLVILSLVLLSQTYADTPPDFSVDQAACAKKNGDPSTGGVLTQNSELTRKFTANEVPPVRNQDSIGWCYAYTASDLLDNYRKTQSKNKEPYSNDNLIAPNGIANAYNYHFTPSKGGNTKQAEYNPDIFTYESGTAADAVQSVIKNGGKYCTEKDLPSTDQLNTTYNEDLSSVKTPGGIFKRSSELKELYQDIGAYDGKDQTNRCAATKAMTEIFPDQKVSDIQAILDKKNGKDALEYFSKLSCGSAAKVYPYTPKIIQDSLSMDLKSNGNGKLTDQNKKKQVVMLSKVDDALASGKIVEVTYSADSIFKYVNQNNYGDDHSSIVVGKMYGVNCKPSYLIKNSWGTQCQNVPIKDPEVKCVDGYFLIPADEMQKSISGSTWLE